MSLQSFVLGQGIIQCVETCSIDITFYSFGFVNRADIIYTRSWREVLRRWHSALFLLYFIVNRINIELVIVLYKQVLFFAGCSTVKMTQQNIYGLPKTAQYIQRYELPHLQLDLFPASLKCLVSCKRPSIIVLAQAALYNGFIIRAMGKLHMFRLS